MADHDGKVELDALCEDGASLRDALLAGDMTEVRFLARRLAASADSLRLGEVLSAANILVNALGADGTPPRAGYGKAVFDLSDAINEVLEGPRP